MVGRFTESCGIIMHSVLLFYWLSLDSLYGSFIPNLMCSYWGVSIEKFGGV